jgi:hypothetical protein
MVLVFVLFSESRDRSEKDIDNYVLKVIILDFLIENKAVN